MSNKHRVIGAIEEFRDDNPIPIRSLVFKDSKDGRSTKQQVYFPENRTSLIYNGILYDWYGREIELDDNIKKVISPFGHGLNNSAYETYLIKRKDDRLAIAELSTIEHCYYDPKFSLQIHAKNKITGNILLNGQELKCKDWSFEKLLDHPIEKTCFNVLEGYQKCQILIGVVYDIPLEKTPGICFYPLLEGHTGAISHLVLKDRKIIMETPPEDLYIPKIYRLDNHSFGNFISGNITFSNDNKKATIHIPTEIGNGLERISTDTEVLLHTKGNPNIIWYHDPE